MRLDGERKYKRISEHQLVDAEEPGSAARRLQRSLITLDFTLKDWRLVARTSGVPDGTEEPPPFSWIQDKPPQIDLRLGLEAAKRRFYAVKDGEGVTPISSLINFRILTSDEGKTVGYLQHVPPWEYGGVTHDHSIEGALFIPPERMAWLVEKLRVPNARLHFRVNAMLYKEEIALSFDEPWYEQDIVLPYEEHVPLMGYGLDVVSGPGSAGRREPGARGGERLRGQLHHRRGARRGDCAAGDRHCGQPPELGDLPARGARDRPADKALT